MMRVRFSPRSSFARTLLLIVTLLFVSLVTTYLVVAALSLGGLPSMSPRDCRNRRVSASSSQLTVGPGGVSIDGGV